MIENFSTTDLFDLLFGPFCDGICGHCIAVGELLSSHSGGMTLSLDL